MQIVVKKIEKYKHVVPQKYFQFIFLFTATFLLIIFTFFLLLNEDERTKEAISYSDAKKIEDGATLYEKNCRNCHGRRGGGVGQLGPALNNESFFQERLQEVGWISTLESYIQATITHGRMIATRPFYAGNGSSAVMAPWHQSYGGSLRSDQIRSLTSFILNWEKSANGNIELKTLPAPTIQIRDMQSIARGKKVFATNCALCHRYDSFQQPKKNAPTLNTIANISGKRVKGVDGISYIRESVLIPEQYIVAGFEEETTQDPCGAILTETELTNLLSYLLQKQE